MADVTGQRYAAGGIVKASRLIVGEVCECMFAHRPGGYGKSLALHDGTPPAKHNFVNS